MLHINTKMLSCTKMVQKQCLLSNNTHSNANYSVKHELKQPWKVDQLSTAFKNYEFFIILLNYFNYSNIQDYSG